MANLEVGDLIREFPIDGTSETVITTRDDKYVITNSATGGIYTNKVWDIETGKLIMSFKLGHASKVSCMATSEDGLHLATGSDDKTIKIWEISTGELVNTLSGHTGDVMSVRFLNNNEVVSSGYHSDNSVKIWNIFNGNLLKNYTTIFKGSNGYSRGFFSLSKDKTFIIISGQENPTGNAINVIRKLELATGNSVIVNNPRATVTNLTLCNDDKFIAYGFQASTHGAKLDIANVSNGSLFKTLAKPTWTASRDTIFSTNKYEFLISTNSNSRILIWDIENDYKLKAIDLSIALTSIYKSNNDRYLIVANASNKIEIRNLIPPIPNKYLFKQDNKIKQPTNLGYVDLVETTIDKNLLKEYGSLELKDIIGKEQTLLIPTKVETLNESELFVSELPKGWSNCKSFEVKEK